MIAEAILDLVLIRADAPLAGAGTFSAEEFTDQPALALPTLGRAGILAPMRPASSVRCDACLDDHWEAVELVQEPHGTRPRLYLVCPTAGRVEVDPARCARWRLDVGALANLVATLLAATGPLEEHIRNRLWGLGHCALDGHPCDVFLARGLGWSDDLAADRVAEVVRGRVAPLILTLSPLSVSSVPGATVLWLGHAIAVTDDRAMLTRDYLEAAARAASVTEAVTPSAAMPVPAAPPTEAYVFRREVQGWLVIYEGQRAQLLPGIGARYLQYLVGHPRKEFHALLLSDLMHSSASTALPHASAAEVQSSGLRTAKGTAAGTGSRRNGWSRAQEYTRVLREQLEDAQAIGNQESVASLQDEMDALRAALDGSKALPGRYGELATEVERARKAVCNAIVRALAPLADQRHGDPALLQHLDNAVKRGVYLSYEPDRLLDWRC